MTFQGMDPERVSAVAASLSAQASALDHIAQNVDGLVRQALHAWPGSDAADFHQWWTQHHRPRLIAAAQGVHGAAADLRHQVSSQVEASGLNGSSTSGATLGGIPFPSGLDADQLETAFGNLTDLVGVPTGLLGALVTGAHFNKYGHYPKFWPKWGDFSRYNKSSVLNHFHGRLAPYAGRIDQLERIGRPLDSFGKKLGTIDVGISAAKVVDSLAGREYGGAAVGALETGASAAKMSKNPVAYLTGVGTQAWVEVGKSAAQADFSSSGFKMVIDEYRRDPWGSLTCGWGESAKSLTKILF